MPLQNTFIFDVDFKMRNLINEPTVTQNDEVSFILNVYDDGTEFDLSSVSTFTLVSVRPDRQSVQNVGRKTGTNQVTFELGSTEIAAVGRVNAVIQLYDVNGRVSTLPFTYTVLKDPVKDYIPSEDDQTLIELVLGQGPAILTAAKEATLDAKEVSDNSIHLGEYDNERLYKRRNEVSYEGSSYVALQDTQANLPTNTTYWVLRARKGLGDVNSVNGVLPNGNGDVVLTEMTHIGMFGAIGDGESDDTVSIQEAINYVSGLGGGNVLVPQGIYMCGNIQLKSNVNLIGLGSSSILKLLPNANLYSINGSIIDTIGNYPSNVIGTTLTHTGGTAYSETRHTEENNVDYLVEDVMIYNLTIDGNKEYNTLGDNGQNASAMGAGIGLHQSKNVVVLNCRIINCRMDGIHIGYSLHGGSDYCKVLDSYIEGNVRTGIAQITGKYNYFSGLTIKHEGTGPGFDIEANLINEVNYRHTVTNCYIENGFGSVAQADAKQHNCIVEGNIIKGRIDLSPASITGGTLITNNQFIGNNTTELLNLHGANYTSIDYEPIVFSDNKATGYVDITSNVAQGGHGHLIFKDNMITSKRGFILTRPYNILIKNNEIYFKGDGVGNLLTYYFNYMDIIPNQGEVRFISNKIRGTGLEQLIVGSGGTNAPPTRKDSLISIIDNDVDITLLNNIIASPFNSISFIGNRFKKFKTINIGDYLVFQDNNVEYDTFQDAFEVAATMNQAKITGNTIKNASLNLIRPLNCLVANNVVLDGTMKLVYSFTSGGIGGNLFKNNILQSTKGTINTAFHMVTGNGYLETDYTSTDDVIDNHHLGLYDAGIYVAENIPESKLVLRNNSFEFPVV